MNTNEFAKRRKRLMQMMGQDSIAILPAALASFRNRDVEYPYRADSDFYYITGLAEPENIAVIVPDRKQGEYLLFCHERDSKRERWVGQRMGPDEAVSQYGADDAFPIEDIDDILPGMLEDKEKVYYTMGFSPDFDQKMMEWLNQIRQKARGGVHTPTEFVALDHILHEMRLYKSRSEISAMRRAVKATVAAHRRAMRYCRPGKMEYQVEAEILHEFMQHGCRFPAYPSIVGGGENSCILHYTDNNTVLLDGDLLLIDAGAENDCYAADITRTFPVNGRFTRDQKAIYDIVLDAQLAAIAKVKPGNHWNDPHRAAVRVITKGLIKLGLLKGDLRQLIKDEAYTRFYAHRTGHWLGMDVHDVGDYKVGNVWRLLEPGMVLTVEPGIYIPAGTKGVAKKWWNIGIRIEDDVLVTRDGCEVLSKDLPKATNDIEALMAS